jgi:hypothetical protein
MRTLSCLAIIFLVTFCHATQVPPQAEPTPAPTLRLDIILEGPWLLYEDQTTLAGKSVLVAIAPLPDKDSHAFHYPLVRTGDGHAIKNSGVYCLYFDTKCGRDGDFTLNNDGYSVVALLKANAKPTWYKGNAKPIWKWPALSSQAMILLLPMPDSYSNEEAWPMQFGAKFDDKGKYYKPYDGWNHSIGVQLHYANGPRRIDIATCALGNTEPQSVNCAAPDPQHMLYNTGTLRVDMRAPDPDWLERLYDYCDFHVRHTYSKMLSLVDGSNPDIQVIDPAIGIDQDGKAAFDDGKKGCLFWDDQNPTHIKLHKPYNEPGSEGSKLSDLVKKVIDGLRGLAKYQGKIDLYRNDKLHGFFSDDVFIEANSLAQQIGESSINLSDNLPRLSQLTMIRSLVLQVFNQTETLNNQLEMDNIKQCQHYKGHCDIDEGNTGENVKKQLAKELNDLQDTALVLLDETPSKDGKDCRAPIMLVQVQ